MSSSAALWAGVPNIRANGIMEIISWLIVLLPVRSHAPAATNRDAPFINKLIWRSRQITLCTAIHSGAIKWPKEAMLMSASLYRE